MPYFGGGGGGQITFCNGL